MVFKIIRSNYNSGEKCLLVTIKISGWVYHCNPVITEISIMFKMYKLVTT